VARFSGHPLRVIKNKWAEKIKKLEEKNPFPEELKTERFAGSSVKIDNVDNIPLLCGLSAAGIFEVKTCQRIIDDILREIKKHE